MLEPALYIAATPIGNLQDVTDRVREALQQATLIAAEDTRHSKIFLDSIGVHGTRMLSCHDYNEAQRAEVIAAEIAQGGSVVLISDAGTPMISDPGFKLVRELCARGIKVTALPGPCAAICALCVSGLPTDKFYFYGFLPVKDKELTEVLSSFAHSCATTVFYESPRRIAHTLELMYTLYPEREAVLCRELTKAFESVYRATVSELYAQVQQDSNMQRGELVLLLAPAPKQTDEVLPPAALKALAQMLQEGMSLKGASRVLSDLLQIKSKLLYQAGLTLKSKMDFNG